MVDEKSALEALEKRELAGFIRCSGDTSGA
jgi:hypothetical protein